MLMHGLPSGRGIYSGQLCILIRLSYITTTIRLPPEYYQLPTIPTTTIITTMSAADEQPFVPKGERAEVPYADDSAAAKEDERTAESEATGKVPSSECITSGYHLIWQSGHLVTALEGRPGYWAGSWPRFGDTASRRGTEGHGDRSVSMKR